MKDFPEEFIKSVCDQTGISDLEKNLDLVTSLSVRHNELDYISVFPKLEEVTLKSFPSIKKEDLDVLQLTVPHLKRLYVVEQTALFELDLSIFPELEEVHILHNDNLKSVVGLNKLKKIEIVNNKKLNDFKCIYDALFCCSDITLDILYLFNLRKMIYDNKQVFDLFTKVNWVECYGYKEHRIIKYKKYMLEDLCNILNGISSKYIFANDSELFKFSVLYKWYIDNIKFDNTIEDPEQEISTYRVFNYTLGNRVSYANAFNLLLRFVGINSSVVYSIDTLDSIGKVGDQNVYSIMGNYDYALIRVQLDGQTYYSDISWDSYASSFDKYDELKVYLNNKEEIKQIHNIVGEGGITDTSSYHGDDADEELEKVERRIVGVDVVLNDIDSTLPGIGGKNISIEYNKKEIAKMKDSLELINRHSDEAKKIEKDIINLEVEIKEFTAKLEDLTNERVKDIIKYKDFIMSNYYCENYEEVYERGFMSDYIYDLINTVVKHENSNN